MTPVQNAAATTYLVEISGWDRDENFFVEKADLEWSEQQDKRVALHHQLRNSAVVFVRLLTAMAVSHSLPLPYQVENMNFTDSAGRWIIQLVQLQPRVHPQAAGSPMRVEPAANKR